MVALDRAVLIALPLMLLLCAVGCTDGAQHYRRGGAVGPGGETLPLPGENPFPEPGQCGLNALCKVLRYHDSGLAPDALLERAPAGAADGMADFEVAALARRLGFACAFGESSLDDVRRSLQRGQPVLALLPSLGSTAGRAHWVVLYGRGAERGVLCVDLGRDGETGTVGVNVFDRLWRQCGRCAVFVSGRQNSSRDGEVTK